MTRLVVALDDEQVDLAEVGGKGLNLVRTTRAGLPVPPGFVVTTAAYLQHVQANGLTDGIAAVLARLPLGSPGVDDPEALEIASRRIRSSITKSPVPQEVCDAVLQRAGELPGPVAVRSSATAEDLPDLSFAGQQDTFLNVIGADDVLARVVDCWASLWAARAIGYRRRAGISHDDVALAVVVQELVPADASGVLFTADPLTGVRDRTVIDATLGLGEALVSGQVDPDHYEIETSTHRILAATAGAKAVRTTARADGGVELVPAVAGEGLALTPSRVHELVALGQRVQDEYGSPQDLEWAIADGRLWLLQARSITSLFDIPKAIGTRAQLVSSPDLEVWFSFGAFQGVLAPFTPIGRDAIGVLAAGGAGMLGQELDPADVGFIGEGGERLWVRLDGLLRNPLGRRLVPVMLGIGEPGSQAIVREVLSDPRLAPRPPQVRTALRLARLMGRVVPGVVVTMVSPRRGRRLFEARAARLVTGARHLVEQAKPDTPCGSVETRLDAQLTRQVGVARASLSPCMRVLLPTFAPVMMPSMLMLGALTRLVNRCGGPGDQQLPLELLRGLAGNVTTDMDLALWQVAQDVRGTAAEADVRAGTPAQACQVFLDGRWPEPAAGALRGFLHRYGMRGVGEIDLGRTRWRDDPTDVVTTLRAYLNIDPANAPDVVYRQAVQAAETAAQRLIGLAGPLRAPAARFATSRIRSLLGARETPKFTIVSVLGLVREGLLECGRSLVEEGVLERAEDVMMLRLAELARGGELARSEDRSGWAGLVVARKAAQEREARRRLVPRVILGDGRTYYHASGTPTEGAVVGSPVSPGSVEGRVRVVLDPVHSGLQPGEILVCPGTDPAWTPLFLTAGGLVCEVGGMMTHGSVVAREYGIPAVVGVPDATSRLPTGTRVRLDGSAGTIELLDEAT